MKRQLTYNVRENSPTAAAYIGAQPPEWKKGVGRCWAPWMFGFVISCL